MSDPVQHIAHCSACGCKMDISAMDPYTNVVCPDCGHHTRVKCELGHYLLTSRHAAGGMSMVFVARDTTLERDVAIKILNDEYSRDEKRMGEFEREAKITAALSHPHIVRVFTVGQSFGHYYIAMELVPGDNLERKISKGGAIGEDEMLPIALEIISGLRAAKSAGVIHRDMKPGNILFDDAGHVKIVDFGLALVTMGGKVKAEEIWATPYYVPPEALDGEEEDFRSDIYALGATLYHALSGRAPLPPEAKSTREVRKAKENIPLLKEVAPWLNSATCSMVDKAMQLRPEDRYSSYAEMEEDWNAAFQIMLGGGAEEPIHGQDRLRRRVKGGKGVLGLAIAAVAALMLVLVAVKFVMDKPVGGVVAFDATVSDADALADAGVGQSNLGQDGSGYDPEVAARIGRLFRSSHQLLRKKKYQEAQNQFVALMHDPDIKEPLPTWSYVEALIAVWLSGEFEDSSDSIHNLIQHLESSSGQQSDEMLELGRMLGSFKAIPDRDVGSEPMAVVQLMAMALKNWEIGAMDDAVPLFEKVGSHPLPPKSPLLVYRGLAKLYLADYQKLKPFSQWDAAVDVAEAHARMAELKKLLRKLQTHGRARFHVRVWQLRLHRQVKQMQKRSQLVDGGGKGPTYESVQPQFKLLLQESKFSEASELLQNVRVKDDQKKLRDSWVYLTDSANTFLGLLEGNIPKSGLVIQIHERSDGAAAKVYRKIISAKSGGLTLFGDDGEVFVPWSAMESGDVISIFQAILKPTLTSLEGQLHTELAVCYAWLSGMEDKAKLAAGKLSGVNRGFRKRWKSAINTLYLNQ